MSRQTGNNYSGARWAFSQRKRTARPQESRDAATQSYTFASVEAVGAMLANLPEHYDMSLNRSDMRTLCKALQLAYYHGHQDAGELLSSIASTLGVEFV